jgi:type III restriction enzyme
MLESKASREMESSEVLAKQKAAVIWGHHASQHAQEHGGKPWQYALIPHEVIAENMSLSGLVAQFGL